MKKNKGFIDSVNTGIFPAIVLLCHGLSYDDIIKLLNRKNSIEWKNALLDDKELIDSGEYFALKRYYNNKKYYYIIIKDKFLFEDYDYCQLSHEVVHICQFLLPDLLDRDREIECEAYLHTHIMQQCLKLLRKYIR